MIAWRWGPLTLGLALIWAMPAAGDDPLDCNRDTVKAVSDIGVFIATASGHIYDVLGQGTIDPVRWQIGEDLLICIDRQGKNLYDVKNLDRGETLVTSRETFLLR